MGSIFLLVVIGTSIWVLIDAKTIGVKKGQIKGIANIGPWGWFFSSLLLWIIAFPIYLAKRGKFKQISSADIADMDSDVISRLENIKKLKEKGAISEAEYNRKKKELLEFL